MTIRPPEEAEYPRDPAGSLREIPSDSNAMETSQCAPISSALLHREVLALAWPSILAMLLQTVNSLMDAFFVGNLPNGRQALAATGIGGIVIFLLISVALGVTIGTMALVARFTGSGEHEKAVEVTGQSLSLAVVLALLFGSAVFLGRGAIASALLGSSGGSGAAALCVQFLSAVLPAAVPLFITNVLQAAFRGLGDTRTPMRITLAMIVTHISLNSVLIYGRLGFPRMGVRGAGTALAASLFVGATLYLFALKRRPELSDALTWRHLRLRADWAWRILRIGMPAALQAVLRTLSLLSFQGMLVKSLEGEAGVAALQIGLRAEAIAYMPGFGYSVAASALVGQNLGAKDPKRAERAAWAATWQAVGVMIAMAIVFYVFATPISRLFTQDVLVQRLGADYLRVNAYCEPFLALGMVLTGALQGAGDTTRPTIITFLTMWILRLPLAYALMFPLGQQTHGAWISMGVSTSVGGLMTVWLFRTGKWKRIKV